jgi:hypothetical protein
LAKADAILEQIRDGSGTHRSWYPLKINVLNDRGASLRDIRKEFLAGVQRFPQDHEIFFAMARSYEPKWGGSKQAYEAFALESAEIAKNFEGIGTYSRLYWLVDYADGG